MTLFRIEAHETYAKLAKQGWVAVIRLLHPDERIYTLWDYFSNIYARNAGRDHLLRDAIVVSRLKSARVDRHVRSCEKASDDAQARLELKPARKKRRECASRRGANSLCET